VAVGAKEVEIRVGKKRLVRSEQAIEEKIKNFQKKEKKT